MSDTTSTSFPSYIFISGLLSYGLHYGDLIDATNFDGQAKVTTRISNIEVYLGFVKLLIKLFGCIGKYLEYIVGMIARYVDVLY